MASESFGDREVERAFEALYEAITSAQLAWSGSDVAGARLDYATSDMLHHVCMAIPGLSLVEAAPEVERMLAREAYLSVLHVSTLAASIERDEPEAGNGFAGTRAAAHTLLDALSPYVGRSDMALRSALLDGADLEDTLQLVDGFASAR